MKVRLGLIITVMTVALVLVAFQPTAEADSIMNFVSASATCTSGTYSIDVDLFFLDGESVEVSGPEDTAVVVYDADGTYLGSDVYWAFESAPLEGIGYGGTIPFLEAADGPYVTFALYYEAYSLPTFGVTEVGPPLDGDETLADSRQVAVDCGADPVVVPGCDVQIPLDGAVGGTFVANAATYWTPGELTSPLITIPASKTVLVFGQDASESYYKVLLECQFLWVEKDTIGPNFDDVWQGTPLPTTIVD
ncbi:MAG: hypothetical protein GYB65_21870 [Chloroflexi bacterium]|nr:hypothetical protein [Chloroflexota bacterium]